MRQLLTEIARAFVDSGDKGFTAWYRARQSIAAVPTHTVNGDEATRTARRSEQPLSPLPSEQEAVGEEDRKR